MNLPALRDRNFRIFLSTHAMMMVGDWLISLAMIWMAFRITNNPFLMGIVSSLSSLPHLIFSPIVGPIADTFNRRLVIFWGQLLIVVLLLSYSLVYFTIGLNYLLVALFAGLYGTLWALMSPSLYGFTYDMVGSDCYINANSIIRTVFSLARIFGPLIGGVLFELAGGWGWCFLVAGVLMIPEVFMLWNIRVECPVKEKRTSFLTNFASGFVHLKEKKTPFYMLAIIALAALFGYSGNLLVAPICEKVLGMPWLKGIFSASLGVGAFFGALAISLYANKSNGLKIFKFSALAFPILGIMIGLSVWLKNPVLIGFFYLSFGSMMVVTNVMGSNLMPSLVDKDFVGRSLGFYNIALMGILPFGDFISGTVSTLLAIPVTIAGLHSLILVPMVFLVSLLNRNTNGASGNQ